MPSILQQISAAFLFFASHAAFSFQHGGKSIRRRTKNWSTEEEKLFGAEGKTVWGNTKKASGQAEKKAGEGAARTRGTGQ